jgi:hypothetical protein
MKGSIALSHISCAKISRIAIVISAKLPTIHDRWILEESEVYSEWEPVSSLLARERIEAPVGFLCGAFRLFKPRSSV